MSALDISAHVKSTQEVEPTPEGVQCESLVDNDSLSGSPEVLGDHNYCGRGGNSDGPDTPRKVDLKRKLNVAKHHVTSYRKRIKLLLQANRRLVKRNAKLSDVIGDLRNKNLMGEDSLSVLEKSACGISDLVKRQVRRFKGQTVAPSYSPELRTFALTLHFYSPQAYRYVRKVFNTCLPHPRTISKWYSSVEGEPGFTTSVFQALHARAACRNNRMVCSLIMDEVAIRQVLQWDGSKYRGYIDLGTETDDDSLPMAKEALCFMIVALNDNFKIPVGYFLINGLGGVERANLVNQCIEKLYDVGVTIVSLTFDGAASNLAMCSTLGCQISAGDAEFKSFFKHPVTLDPVVVFLDPCHMLKLVRNTIGDKKTLVDDSNCFVNFEYIVKLHKLQDAEGLHLGNKLRQAHVLWYKKKMNVKLAAQLLSESVASSLLYCLEQQLPGFSGCEATIKFIKLFNSLFDVFNSRNLHGKGLKAPIGVRNYSEVYSFLVTAREYIVGLKESPNGRSIISSNRKTGFLGFLVCIESLLVLYDMVVSSGKCNMSFICTYKFSQDHIELLFGKLRSLGGSNNNPSAWQFRSAYRKLLVHNEIQDAMRGNCLSLQDIPVLTVSSSCLSATDGVSPSAAAINSTCGRVCLVDLCESAGVVEDHTYVKRLELISECSEHIVTYIAGFVVHKLVKILHCETCIGALRCTDVRPSHCLITVKNHGGLVFPSKDVIDICLACDKLFRQYVYDVASSRVLRTSVQNIVQCVLESYISKDVFTSLSVHMLEYGPLENHLVLLIKAIAEKYLQVRYYYAGRMFSAKMQAHTTKGSRQIYTKLILFSGM